MFFTRSTCRLASGLISRPRPVLSPRLYRPTPSSITPIPHRTIVSKHPPNFVPPTAADLQELRESVQDFARREIPEDLAAATDANNEFPNEMWKKLGEAGLLGVTASEEYGGLGMGYQAHCVVMEELSRASGSIGLSYAAHSQLCINQLNINATPEQKAMHLPSLIAGERIGALAMSEAGAGSDVVSMRTTATAVDGGFRIDGTKMWITNGPDAHLVVVYAKTNPGAGKDGITAFLVDTASAGFGVARKLSKLGMRGSNTGELVLDGVFVPTSQVLGRVDAGVRVLMEGLDFERLVLSAGPLGLMQRALDEVLPYVHQRKQFGVPIAEKQLVQGKLADMYTALQAARALTMSVAARIDAAHADPSSGFSSRDCTAAILFAAERATQVTLDGIQLLGGMGYVDEMPVGRLMRDAKLYEIGAGTSEVRRMVVARSLSREFGA